MEYIGSKDRIEHSKPVRFTGVAAKVEEVSTTKDMSVSNGSTNGSGWWRTAVLGAMLTFMVGATLKGWDNWSTTNDVLTRLDERAKAREQWDAHQNMQLQRLEQSLASLAHDLENRAEIGRVAIEDLQRWRRQLEDQYRPSKR